MAILKRLRLPELPKRPDLSDESGQSILEYVLLLVIIVSGYVLFMQGLARSGVARKLTAPITESYRFAYKYGHVLARGPEEGGYNEMHPGAPTRGGYGGNPRIFINARTRQ